MSELDTDHLQLTDFMDLPQLQEIQDNFAAIANVRAIITDAAGNVLTQPQPTKEFLQRQRVIAAAAEEEPAGPQKQGTEYIAPITVNGQRLGTLRMSVNGSPAALEDGKADALAAKFGIEARQVKSLATQLAK